MRVKHRQPERRRRVRRKTLRRPRTFRDVFQNFVLAGSVIGVIYGQAEMLGEPWRHFLAVGAAVMMAGVAIWMKET